MVTYHFEGEIYRNNLFTKLDLILLKHGASYYVSSNKNGEKAEHPGSIHLYEPTLCIHTHTHTKCDPESQEDASSSFLF